MKPDLSRISREQWREHRRRRFRRRRRHAYIRSVYSLPSLATLGNAICGFGAMYIAGLTPEHAGNDPWTRWFAQYHFTIAAYLIFAAMLFDALDGRLARLARHTTDFGGQLDSLADVISFGAAPAFLALQLFRSSVINVPFFLSRAIWAAGALYMSCAAIRLARFNVSNEHGEQHHFSFLGLPSPGAAGTVAAFIGMQQEIVQQAEAMQSPLLANVALLCIWALPVIVIGTGLLMVSNIRYPHLVNRYLRGKKSFARLIAALVLVLVVIISPKYALALGTLIYAGWGLVGSTFLRLKPRPAAVPSVETPSPLPHPPASR